MKKTFQHALKTGVAASLTWILYAWLPLPDRTRPVWAVVTTVLVMQSNLGGVLRSSGIRVLGTAIGALIGAAMASVLGRHEISLLLAVTLTLGLLGSVGLPETLRLAGVTAAVVIVGVFPDHGPFHVGLMRFVDVVIGTGVAIAVQTFVWPNRANDDLGDAVLVLVHAVRELYPMSAEVTDKPFTPDEGGTRDGLRVELIGSLAKLREVFGDLQREPGDHAKQLQLWTGYLTLCEELEHHTLSLEHSQRSLRGDVLTGHLADPLRSLAALTVQGLDRIIGRLEEPLEPVAVNASIETAVAAADAALTRVREEGLTLAYPTTEVVRFCTFFFNLRAVSRHVAALEVLAARGA